MLITLPVDFTESLEFRRLQSILDSKANAVAVFMSLFQNLGYLQREGNPTGRILKSDVVVFESDLKEFCGGNATELFNRLASEVRLLVCDEDGFYCPMFERYNRSVPTSKSMQAMGGKMAHWYDKLEKIDKESIQGALLMPKDILVNQAGEPLDSDRTRRIRALIMRCDLALGHNVRPEPHYTAELVQNALAVVEKLSDDQIVAACTLIIKHRGTKTQTPHPALIGLTTEKLLPRFVEVGDKLQTA